MPLIKMSPDTGSNPNDSGMSRAIAVIGPRPGITPTIVPTRTPRKQYQRFVGVIAFPSPSSSALSASIVLALQPTRPAGSCTVKSSVNA